MSKRILVVEDQPDNRQIIRDMLAPTDYEITEAENGEQALTAIAKAAARSHFDGYPVTNHGRLRSDAPHQGRRFAARNPDHRGYVLCAQRRRTKGASGWLR
jgi:CheY-like chemotaxis protein